MEIFNLKNKDCQEQFKKMTTDTKVLSTAFREDEDLNISANRFMKRLDKMINACFKKIRIGKPLVNHEVNKLFERRKNLKNKDDPKSQLELVKVENKLSEMCAEENLKKIKEEVEGINCETGGVNSGNLWKLKKKLCPKSRDPPTAMKDEDGNLVTSSDKILDIALNAYVKRLEHRPMNEELKELKKLKEKVFELKMKKAKEVQTLPWTKEQVTKVLKTLKKDKSRDPMGLANEIFHPDVAGDDFIDAIIILMNRIKAEQVYPEIMELCNISSIYKGKGPRDDFNSYRGIFRISGIKKHSG